MCGLSGVWCGVCVCVCGVCEVCLHLSFQYLKKKKKKKKKKRQVTVVWAWAGKRETADPELCRVCAWRTGGRDPAGCDCRARACVLAIDEWCVCVVIGHDVCVCVHSNELASSADCARSEF